MSRMTVDADAPVRVFLARHAESVLNALGRVQGWADSPLTDRGRREAERLGHELRGAGASLAAVHCADMLRHRQTAERALAAAAPELTPVSDPRLRELAFGRFEGADDATLWEAVAADQGHADAAALRADSEFDVLTALGAIRRLGARSGLPSEDPSAVRARMLDVLSSIAREAGARGGGDVLVISSGLSIMLALDAMGVAPKALEGGIRNASFSVLGWRRGAWTVERANGFEIHPAAR